MRYGQPRQLTKSEAEEIFASNDMEAICESLVSLALNESDWQWTQDKCIEFTQHAEWALRAIAATCLGQLARIHGSLDLDKVKPRILELMKDPRTSGYTQDAAGDIKMFMAVDLSSPG